MASEPMDSGDTPEDTPLEQLAKRFETYAADNEHLLSRGYMYKGIERTRLSERIKTWRDVAKELRELEPELTNKGLKLVLTAIGNVWVTPNDDGSVD